MHLKEKLYKLLIPLMMNDDCEESVVQCQHWAEITKKYPKPSDWQLEQESLKDKKSTELLPGSILIFELVLKHGGVYHPVVFSRYIKSAIKDFKLSNEFADRIYWSSMKSIIPNDLDEMIELSILQEYGYILLSFLSELISKVPNSGTPSPPQQ